MADADAARIAQHRRRQIAGIDAQQRQVSVLIFAGQDAVIGFSVERLHQKLGATVGYMAVGDNESVRGKDKSRSASRRPQLAPPVAPEDFNLHHRAAGPRRYAGHHLRVSIQGILLQGSDITAARLAAGNFMI